MKIWLHLVAGARPILSPVSRQPLLVNYNISSTALYRMQLFMKSGKYTPITAV